MMSVFRWQQDYPIYQVQLQSFEREVGVGYLLRDNQRHIVVPLYHRAVVFGIDGQLPYLKRFIQLPVALVASDHVKEPIAASSFCQQENTVCYDRIAGES